MGLRLVILFVVAILFSACIHSIINPNQNVKVFTLQNEPAIGTTLADQKVLLGGFSGLQILRREGNTFDLLTITDRGPNGPHIGQRRSFLLPDYSPRFVKLRLNAETGDVAVTEQIPLRDENGKALTGLPPKSPLSEFEVAVDGKGHKLPPDPNGVDSESLCVDKDQTIWVGEEYGPDLMRFQADGKLLARLRPGRELPAWLRERRANRGFEGIACADNHVYMMLQSPLRVIDAKNETTVRLLDYDVKKKAVVGVYVYLLDSGADLIGDLHAIGGGKFLAIEQNGKRGPRNLYSFDISKARNWLTAAETPERLALKDLSSQAITKKHALDLHQQGYDVEKAEGLAILNDDLILVSDNDFGLKGNVDFKTGHISLDGKKTVFAWLHGASKLSE